MTTGYVVRALLPVLAASCMALDATAARVAAAAPAEAPNVVDVVAKDYRFDMPDTLPAGPTLFNLTNNGAQLHHMTLVKLGSGKTLADLTALPPGKPLPKWMRFEGGPNAPAPHGGRSETALDLTAGHYAVICLIPGPDGKPHMMHGMVKALTVVPSTTKRALPRGDTTITLTDYAFTLSKPLTPGRHTVRIVNRGTQPHEAVFVRLAAGKSGEDMARWVIGGMHGPPPGLPFAGVSPMAPGQKNLAVVNLTAGRYALLCFMPDARDGRLHAAHGMIHEFTIL